MTDKATDSPCFIAETEALLWLALLAARVDDGVVTFPGFAEDIREALVAAYERGREFR